MRCYIGHGGMSLTLHFKFNRFSKANLLALQFFMQIFQRIMLASNRELFIGVREGFLLLFFPLNYYSFHKKPLTESS